MSLLLNMTTPMYIKNNAGYTHIILGFLVFVLVFIAVMYFVAD